MWATPFIVTYKNLRKVVQCKEYANIYDDVALKFSNCKYFQGALNCSMKIKQ